MDLRSVPVDPGDESSSHSRISNYEPVNRVLAAAALAAFIVAMLTITIKSATSGGGSRVVTTTVRTTIETQTTTAPTTTSSVPISQPVKLTAVGAYDPEGDQHENDDLAPLAVDGNPVSAWKTEHYRNGFSKQGVGLVLDADKSRPISQVVVATDGAGSSAQIELGDAPGGPFDTVSADLPLDGKTTFTLTQGSAGRYVVVWITALPKATGEAHVTEVTARS